MTVPSAKSPKHRVLHERLLADIRSGRLREGQALPPERDLEELHQVSRITVRGALASLQRDGHIERRQGSGTYVRALVHEAKPAANRTVTLLYGQVHGDRGNDRFLGELVQAIDARLSVDGRALRMQCHPIGSLPEQRLAMLLEEPEPKLVLVGYDPGSDFVSRLCAVGGRAVSLGRLGRIESRVIEISGRHEESMYWATLHLLDHGCRRIALVNGPYSLWLCRDRLAGFRRAHHDRGVQIDESLLVASPMWQINTGRNTARAILDKTLVVDGVVCCGDWAAFGLINELRQHGCEPGRDLPVVVGDWYHWMTEATGLELTGLHEPRERLATTALDLLDDPDAAATADPVLVAIDFVIRGSCGCGGTSSMVRGKSKS